MYEFMLAGANVCMCLFLCVRIFHASVSCVCLCNHMSVCVLCLHEYVLVFVFMWVNLFARICLFGTRVSGVFAFCNRMCAFMWMRLCLSYLCVYVCCVCVYMCVVISFLDDGTLYLMHLTLYISQCSLTLFRRKTICIAVSLEASS